MLRKGILGLTVLFLMAALQRPAQAADLSQDALAKDFAATYAQIAFLNYQESFNTAAELEEKIEEFVENHTAEGLEAAKEAWKVSRIPYGQSEIFRFADGPIDGKNEKGEDGPEGRLNAWPLNEAYIDYVQDNMKAGIIQDVTVPINEDTLVKKNQADDEKDVTTGYHAIEFLLWGQDFNSNGPGQRPLSDYLKDNPVHERRQAYLKETAELLLKDLLSMVNSWAPDKDNYRKQFAVLPTKEVLSKALTSLASLSGSELASERIGDALKTGDQEDEQSCFSDNTHIDYQMNVKGIENVYYGRYGNYQGVGLNQIAAHIDADLAKRIDAQLTKTRSMIEAIKPPIDQILASPAGSPGKLQLEAIVESLQAQADLFKELAQKMDINIALENS